MPATGYATDGQAHKEIQDRTDDEMRALVDGALEDMLAAITA